MDVIYGLANLRSPHYMGHTMRRQAERPPYGSISNQPAYFPAIVNPLSKPKIQNPIHPVHRCQKLPRHRNAGPVTVIPAQAGIHARNRLKRTAANGNGPDGAGRSSLVAAPAAHGLIHFGIRLGKIVQLAANVACHSLAKWSIGKIIARSSANKPARCGPDLRSPYYMGAAVAAAPIESGSAGW